VNCMSSQQVREILILYRPGTADREDTEVAEALALVIHDPGLSRWFAKHGALCEVLRNKFRQIPVPLTSFRMLKARWYQRSASDFWSR
jgi:hypothetical protein